MRFGSKLLLLTIFLALIGAGFGVYFLTTQPRSLRIAVGPEGQETHQYVMALAQAAEEGRERIRFKVVDTAGAAESALLLDKAGVDLAVIRSDYDLPANGQTLIVNARRTLVLVAPVRRNGIRKLSDLKGKRIAVVQLTDSNLPLVRKLLEIVDIGTNDATLTETEAADAQERLKSGRADALIIVAPRTAPAMTSTLAALNRQVPGGIRIVPIAEAQAAADKIIGVETIDIPVSAFGNGLPKEETASLAVSYRIMARKSLSDDLAGRAAKTLYDLRTRLSRSTPQAFSAEPPDAKTGARIPTHPGATAYFEGETKSFYERYGEAILTGVWGLSIFGSGIAGFFAWAGRRKHSATGRIIEEITALTGQARIAEDAATLATIENRADAIVAEIAAGAHAGNVSSSMLESISFALEHLRSVSDGTRERVAS